MILILSISAVASLIIAVAFLYVMDNVNKEIILSDLVGNQKEQNQFFLTLKKLFSTIKYNKEDSESKLISAGIHSELIASGYYFFKLVPFLLMSVVSGYLLYLDAISVIIFTLLFFAAVLIFLIIPDMYVSSRGKSNIRRMNQRLPFLLDLMYICVNTGMTVESSLTYLAKELSIIDRELSYVLQKTVDRMEVVGIDKALNEFHEMLPTSEAKSFVTTISNNVKFGSSIGPVLLTLASDIREINMLELEEKIGKMSAKMSIPMIVFIMIPIVVLIVAPGIMRILMS